MAAAGFGVVNAVPAFDATQWPAQATSAKAELDARAAQAAALEAASRAPARPATALRDHDIARLQIVFGNGLAVAAA